MTQSRCQMQVVFPVEPAQIAKKITFSPPIISIPFFFLTVLNSLGAYLKHSSQLTSTVSLKYQAFVAPKDKEKNIEIQSQFSAIYAKHVTKRQSQNVFWARSWYLLIHQYFSSICRFVNLQGNTLTRVILILIIRAGYYYFPR